MSAQRLVAVALATVLSGCAGESQFNYNTELESRDWIGTEHDRYVIALGRLFLRPLAGLAGLVMSSVTPLTRHRVGEPLGVIG